MDLHSGILQVGASILLALVIVGMLVEGVGGVGLESARASKTESTAMPIPPRDWPFSDRSFWCIHT